MSNSFGFDSLALVMLIEPIITAERTARASPMGADWTKEPESLKVVGSNRTKPENKQPKPQLPELGSQAASTWHTTAFNIFKSQLPRFKNQLPASNIFFFLLKELLSDESKGSFQSRTRC